MVFGPTFLYLGFGGLLLLSLYVRDVLPRSLTGPLAKLGSACAFVGLYSYSIYLWQGVFGRYTIRGFRQYFHIQLSGFPFFAWYFLGCLVFGIVMARLIEFPVLRLREKFFPPVDTLVVVRPVAGACDSLISAKNA